MKYSTLPFDIVRKVAMISGKASAGPWFTERKASNYAIKSETDKSLRKGPKLIAYARIDESGLSPNADFIVFSRNHIMDYANVIAELANPYCQCSRRFIDHIRSFGRYVCPNQNGLMVFDYDFEKTYNEAFERVS